MVRGGSDIRARRAGSGHREVADYAQSFEYIAVSGDLSNSRRGRRSRMLTYDSLIGPRRIHAHTIGPTCTELERRILGLVNQILIKHLPPISRSDSGFFLPMNSLSTMYLGVDTHIVSKGRVRLPSGRSSGCTDLLHHPVDLLESQSLGLPHHEVGVATLSVKALDIAMNRKNLHGTSDTSSSPNKEDFGLEIGLIRADQVWSDDSQDTIPELPDQLHEHKYHSGKLLTQHEEVDSPTPRDRIGMGKISPITTQAPGPHVEAKKKM